MCSKKNWIEEYKSFMVLKNFSPRTIKTYCSIIEYFFRYCEKHFPELELNDDLFKKYLGSNQKFGEKPVSRTPSFSKVILNSFLLFTLFFFVLNQKNQDCFHFLRLK